MQPGEKTLSVKYLGITVTADLLPNGKIRSTDSGEIFSTPSSWAVSCKKNINPTKSSGCGWSAIRYKGKPLDTYKSKWMRENHDSARGSPISLPTAPSSGVSTPKLEPSPLLSNRLYSYGRNPSSPLVIDVKPNNPTDLLYPAMSGLPLSEYKTHIGTQVRCEGIEFSVRVLLTRSVCLRMAELSRSSKDEVSGYLAGTYNSLSNLLNVIQVFDKSEPHTRQRVLQSGLKLVGWFHSHPNKTYYPSVYDVECHMNYQLRLREQPIVACIIGDC
ncbi:MPND [Bugula neritina]|uniref:MPND n=1 Tax=Bugula neritina TaxID=10212 RepID=A0A7J7K5R4_BUGNE|nr:MPND [Bugula neritina]